MFCLLPVEKLLFNKNCFLSVSCSQYSLLYVTLKVPWFDHTLFLNQYCNTKLIIKTPTKQVSSTSQLHLEKFWKKISCLFGEKLSWKGSCWRSLVTGVWLTTNLILAVDAFQCEEQHYECVCVTLSNVSTLLYLARSQVCTSWLVSQAHILSQPTATRCLLCPWQRPYGRRVTPGTSIM